MTSTSWLSERIAELRAEQPGICWKLLDNDDRACIRDRGHDDGVHERSRPDSPEPSAAVHFAIPHTADLSRWRTACGIPITNAERWVTTGVERVTCANCLRTEKFL